MTNTICVSYAWMRDVSITISRSALPNDQEMLVRTLKRPAKFDDPPKLWQPACRKSVMAKSTSRP